MSLSGNNHNSGSRTSIFETFHTPNFGDENFEMQPVTLSQPVKTYSKPTTNKTSDSTSSLQSITQEQAEEEEEEEMLGEEDDEASSCENAETTLWMSCSPGRDFTDDEEEEEAPRQRIEELEDFEGEEEEEENGESSDDGLPLSKLAGKRFLEGGPNQISRKRIKLSKDLKSQKALKKPLTAYAFFYRDTQNAIKSQNPQATFGEISKIVASMWDRLDSELKEEYNKRAEESKKDYLKKLAEYCALNKDKMLPLTKSKSKKTKKPSLVPKPKRNKLQDLDSLSESQDGPSNEEIDDIVDPFSVDSFYKSSSPKQDEKEDGDKKLKPICNYTKCQNPAVDDPRWENNYCSSDCVITHCKDIFSAWVANRKNTYCET